MIGADVVLPRPGVIPAGTRVMWDRGAVPADVGGDGRVVAVGPKYTRVRVAGDTVPERRVDNRRVRLAPRVAGPEAGSPLHPLDVGPVARVGTRWDVLGFQMPYWQWLTWTIAEHLEYAAGLRPLEGPPVPPPSRLVLVGCGAAKAPVAHIDAHALYSGTYYRSCRSAAARFGGLQMILSARFGLLGEHDVLGPYDLRLGQGAAITVPELRWQAHQFGLSHTPEVVVIAGGEYTRLAQQVWPHAYAPLAGTRGMPEQKRILAELARADTEPTTPILHLPTEA